VEIDMSIVADVAEVAEAPNAVATAIPAFFLKVGLYLVIGLLIFGLGYGARYVHELKQAKDNLTQVRAEDGASVMLMQGAEKKLQGTLRDAKGVTDAATLKITFIKPLPKSELNAKSLTPGSPAQCSVDPSLSASLVGVLNAARSGAAPPSTAWLDAEGQQTSFTRLSGLAASDNVIAGMYTALGIRHDALVDYVADLQAKQLARLKKAQ
jgi:hypothetical protein